MLLIGLGCQTVVFIRVHLALSSWPFVHLFIILGVPLKFTCLLPPHGRVHRGFSYHLARKQLPLDSLTWGNLKKEKFNWLQLTQTNWSDTAAIIGFSFLHGICSSFLNLPEEDLEGTLERLAAPDQR